MAGTIAGVLSFTCRWRRRARSLLTVLALSLVSAGLPLRAGVSGEVDCSDPRSVPELNYCSQQTFRGADDDLNQVWTELRTHLSPEAQRAMRDAQRAWIRFRDLNCEALTYEGRGGSGWSGMLFDCLERMTRERIQELRTLAEDY